MRTLLALALLALPFAVAQPDPVPVRIVVTNTSPQPISPPLLVAHHGGFAAFALGGAPSDALARLAEDGDAAPLAAAARAMMGVTDVVVADGLLMPGASVTLEARAPANGYLTLLGMLVTSNDAFVAWTASVAAVTGMGMGHADAMAGAMGPAFADGVARVFDAGSEANTESCAHIPGPPCGHAGARASDGAEGVVALHGGILGVGDLDPSTWDWRYPVVTVAPAM